MKITHQKIEASTHDRISMLEAKIAELEQQIAEAEAGEADPEYLIDKQIELDTLKDELNFAWQDDEAEYNYALQQQEFNPDGSLKGYGDTYASTDAVQEFKSKEDFDIADWREYYLNHGNTLETAQRRAEVEYEKYHPDVTAVESSTNIIPNKKIQKGLQFNNDGHRYEVLSVNGDTCKVSEDWIAEDTGEEVHKEYTYKIGQDADGQEYCYDPEYEEYAKPGSDNYSWWARKYASGADNYPWSWDDNIIPDEDKHDFDYMGYSVLYSPDQDVFRIDSYLGNSIDVGFDFEDKDAAMQWIDKQNSDDEYTPSATAGDYSPSNPWDAPGMSMSDFI